MWHHQKLKVAPSDRHEKPITLEWGSISLFHWNRALSDPDTAVEFYTNRTTRKKGDRRIPYYFFKERDSRSIILNSWLRYAVCMHDAGTIFSTHERTLSALLPLFSYLCFPLSFDLFPWLSWVLSCHEPSFLLLTTVGCCIMLFSAFHMRRMVRVPLTEPHDGPNRLFLMDRRCHDFSVQDK
jgi:hypothetical protein